VSTLPRPCLSCAVLIAKGSYCSECGSTKNRGYHDGWDALSKRILARDHHECQLQGRGCKGRATTVDHVIPKSMGGTDDPENLVAACRSCNSSKGPRVF
jgi:5-methylcytosine-specific restriction endonuclease McrA